MHKIILLMGAVLMLSACATWSTSSVKGTDQGAMSTSAIAQTSPDKIIITEADIGDRKYKVLGDIEVNVNKTTIFNADPTPGKVNERLRKEAAKLGADAVILVRYGTVGVSVLGGWGSLNGKGRAIAFVE